MGIIILDLTNLPEQDPCYRCGATLRQQKSEDCKHIHCYRQHLKKD